MRLSPIPLLHRLRALVTPGTLRIGARARIAAGARLAFRRGSLTIGREARLHHGALIDALRGRVVIGDNFSLNPYSIVYGLGDVTIGDDVRVAAHVVVVAFDHNVEDRARPIRMQGVTKKPVVIESDVWIGAGARILGGSHVRRGCVVGANAVLKGDTEPYGIYVGNPARLLRFRGASSRVAVPHDGLEAS